MSDSTSLTLRIPQRHQAQFESTIEPDYDWDEVRRTTCGDVPLSVYEDHSAINGELDCMAELVAENIPFITEVDPRAEISHHFHVGYFDKHGLYCYQTLPATQYNTLSFNTVSELISTSGSLSELQTAFEQLKTKHYCPTFQEQHHILIAQHQPGLTA